MDFLRERIRCGIRDIFQKSRVLGEVRQCESLEFEALATEVVVDEVNELLLRDIARGCEVGEGGQDDF